jgi:hypothetical protein
MGHTAEEEEGEIEDEAGDVVEGFGVEAVLDEFLFGGHVEFEFAFGVPTVDETVAGSRGLQAEDSGDWGDAVEDFHGVGVRVMVMDGWGWLLFIFGYIICYVGFVNWRKGKG